jgi:hypothetical protein
MEGCFTRFLTVHLTISGLVFLREDGKIAIKTSTVLKSAETQMDAGAWQCLQDCDLDKLLLS